MRLAVGQVHDADGIRWRAGGMMIQNIAEDQARGSTADAWERAQALFATLGEDELIDPTIAAETLLFRLFHEDGVRLFPAKALTAFCRCSEDRVTGMLRSFPKEDIDGMMEGRRQDPRHLRILLARVRAGACGGRGGGRLALRLSHRQRTHHRGLGLHHRLLRHGQPHRQPLAAAARA